MAAYNRAFTDGQPAKMIERVSTYASEVSPNGGCHLRYWAVGHSWQR